ncbi:MAG: hypothetical protein WC223_11015 [Bacteroidales bacterium]|jgi:hypothetical protein
MDPWIDKKLDGFFNRKPGERLNMDIFNQIFARIEELKDTNTELYNHELWRIRDFKNCIDYAYEEGARIGSEKVAKNMKKIGTDIDIIVKYTKLSEEQIEKL